MANPAQPPRPPAAPIPPRNRSNFFWIALLLLTLICIVGGLGILIGVRVITNAFHVNVNPSGAGKKDVSVTTPFGSLNVHEGVNEAGLGVPIYPGATAIKENSSATVNLEISNEKKVRVLAGKFETPDSTEKVIAFYREHLGQEVTKVKDEDGKTVFEIQHGTETRVVGIQPEAGKTVIEIAHVSQGLTGAN